ncbi:alcohol dehydrogenase [Arthrobacter sp. Hiyo6]|nr:alcohol dehydrogenase [Arthrobacter sp. Hiyo6]
MVNSCGECVNCQSGEEQYCLAGNTGTYGASTVTERSPRAATPLTLW